jgi:hypothetical protein
MKKRIIKNGVYEFKKRPWKEECPQCGYSGKMKYEVVTKDSHESIEYIDLIDVLEYTCGRCRCMWEYREKI